MPHGVRRRVLAGLAVLTLGARGDDCASWTLAWWTPAWRELHYAEHELLANVSISASRHVELNPVTALHREQGPEAAQRARQTWPREELERRRSDLLDAALETEPTDCTIAAVRIRQSPRCEATARIAAAYAQRGLRVAFVLFGEEGERSCTTCSAFYARAPLVIRHYHDPTCEAPALRRLGVEADGRVGEADAPPGPPRVMTVPMGNGDMTKPEAARALARASRERASSTRRFRWSFASAHRTPARNVVANAFDAWWAARGSAPDARLLAYPGKDPEYATNLGDSRFVLCPRGNVEDTWRLYEALAAGAIPVVTDGGEYFSQFLPRELVTRFIVLDADLSDATFARAFARIDALLEDEGALDEHQRALIDAYERFEVAWRVSLADGLEAVGRARTARAGAG